MLQRFFFIKWNIFFIMPRSKSLFKVLICLLILTIYFFQSFLQKLFLFICVYVHNNMLCTPQKPNINFMRKKLQVARTLHTSNYDGIVCVSGDGILVEVSFICIIFFGSESHYGCVWHDLTVKRRWSLISPDS